MACALLASHCGSTQEPGATGGSGGGVDGGFGDGESGGAGSGGGSGDSGSVLPGCSLDADGVSNCAGGESCCASGPVTGGAFFRTYGSAPTADPATVSSFRLDRFEITVGRFRRFVDAWQTGWRPTDGDGKHAHLSGGGLNDGGEHGWDWASAEADGLSRSDDRNLVVGSETCCPVGQACATWTPSPGDHETEPINCVSWHAAYAFCIWDGGFLPTEAEWLYAAAGGAEQRVYPWSVPSSSTEIDASRAVYCGDCVPHPLPVGSKPSGDGRFGTADLVGNVSEWLLDWYADAYPMPCADCTANSTSIGRVQRGGAYDNLAQQLLNRTWSRPGYVSPSVGARCARAP